MLTVTISNRRWPYMRYIVSNSGNSSRQGPHHVAQKSTRSNLSEAFFRRSPNSGAAARFTVIGLFSIFAIASMRLFSLYAHLVEQPTEGVEGKLTGFPASN